MFFVGRSIFDRGGPFFIMKVGPPGPGFIMKIGQRVQYKTGPYFIPHRQVVQVCLSDTHHSQMLKDYTCRRIYSSNVNHCLTLSRLGGSRPLSHR